MKRLKYAAALVLAAVFAVTLTACSGFADRVTGFVDAATYMIGDENIRTESNITLSLSDGAAPVSFAGLVNSLAAGSEDALTSYKMGISFTSEVYEDTAMVSISWLGEDGDTETLMSVVMVNGTVYIGLELLGFIDRIDVLAEFAPMLLLFNYDYIAIEADYLYELLELDVSELNTLDDMAGLEAFDLILRSAADTFTDVLRNYTPQVLTREVLTQNNDTYTLSLDAQDTIALIGEILIIAQENEEAIKDYLSELIVELRNLTEMDLYEADEMLESLHKADFAEIAREFSEEAADIVIGEDIPDFNFVLSVSGTGRGADKKQTAAMSFVIADLSAFDDDLPFDMLALEIDSITTVTQSPVEAPIGNIVSLEDLMALIEAFALF